MGLAVPTSILVGTERAAQLGILVRSGEALQKLQDVQVVAVDKTGTLTEGHPSLTDIQVLNDIPQDKVIRMAAALERQSEHPIAKAIVAYAEENFHELPKATSFLTTTGMGASALVEDEQVDIGAERFMAHLGIETAQAKDIFDAFGAEAKTPVYVAIDGELCAVLAVADPIKPTAKPAIDALKSRGIKVAMLTGDNTKTANAVAHVLGIDTVKAEILPKDKVDEVERLKAKGNVAFIGDGINDAPALAAADIGLAVGTGTDVAIETSDVILLHGQMDTVLSAIRLSRKTMRNIWQNLFWAFGYNVLLLPIAAGVLLPSFGIMLSPMLAAGAMAFSSVFVLGNALRLRWAAAS